MNTTVGAQQADGLVFSGPCYVQTELDGLNESIVTPWGDVVITTNAESAIFGTPGQKAQQAEAISAATDAALKVLNTPSSGPHRHVTRSGSVIDLERIIRYVAADTESTPPRGLGWVERSMFFMLGALTVLAAPEIIQRAGLLLSGAL